MDAVPTMKKKLKIRSECQVRYVVVRAWLYFNPDGRFCYSRNPDLLQNMQRMVLHDWPKPVRVAESVLAADPVI
ncbi:unnamed protein product [Sphagnum tenellum]